MESQTATTPQPSRLAWLVRGNLPAYSGFLWLVSLFTLGLLLPPSWSLVLGMTFWGLMNAGLLAARPAAEDSRRDE
jgi:hypothetical protein